MLAGAGELPLIACRNARAQGWHAVVYHFTETRLHPNFAAETALLIRHVSLGSIAQVFAWLQEDAITHVILLGKLEKQRLLQDVRRDAAAERLYLSAPDRRDDTLFLQFAEAITRTGLVILPQRQLLTGCFLARGVHTRLKPTDPALLEDMQFGYALSQKIGSLDIGQTAVVFEKMVLAVEAIEGTDAAIRRAGEILRGRHAGAPEAANADFFYSRRGGVVCKTAKACQDPRFDLPAVGMQTLQAMAESGMSALVIEAAETLVVDPEAFVARADALELIVEAR